MPIWPFFTALTVGIAPAGFADTTTPTAQPLPWLQTAAEEAEEPAILRKWTVPAAGLYTLRVPANSGMKVSLDGKLVVDATGSRLDDVGEAITALISLEPGDHVISITGITEENISLSEVTLNPSGETPVQLYKLTTEIDALEGEAILAAQTVLNTPSGTATEATTASFSATGDRTPFTIGGGSSGQSKATAAAAAATAAGAAQPGAVQMASAAMPTQMMPASGGVVSTPVTSGGSISSGSSSGGSSNGGSSGSGGTGGGSNNANGGTGGGAGTPTPTPTPVPTPTPTPPPAPSTPVTVSAPPLTPPANPMLTQAIQLTSAGGEQGIIPSSGATLFGAVSADSVFDIMNVVVGPTNRATTVDVGAQTGQFAVRLFEEDFSQGSEITVTLTGALSSSAEVESQPVTYTLTGIQADNGVGQALSRMTYGTTAELYARVSAMGFQAFVQEQLNPATIDDSAFTSTRPQDLLDADTRNTGRMFDSLMAHDIAHAAFSERQLQEVMANFWANHFHAITKDTSITQQNITDRAFFRDNALGNFEDMLLYSARSPLMSQYLDNDQNRRNAINENYGREILELSSVGVDAGYGPEDVIAVSRIFTGWAYTRTRDGRDADIADQYEFTFFPDRHDTDDKVIPFLGITIAGLEGEAGVQEGEQLISILAQHPSTRSYVCGKIVQLLVSDTPPADLTAACAAAWETSGGEVVPMLEAILLNPSFIGNVEYQRNKSKTPFEYAVSTIRAFGARPSDDNPADFYRRFRDVFEDAGYVPLYYPNPTGLAEVGSAWTSSARLVAAYEGMNFISEQRQNFGIDLLEDVVDAGLETAEEVATYLMTIATADRFTQTEFDQLVAVLKGPDMIFDPLSDGANETAALERAMGLITVTPSFLLQ